MEDLLLKIVENTSKTSSHQIIVTGNETLIKNRFNPAIELDKKKKYEIALINLETYYSFPNITTTNNRLKYSPDNGTTWIDICIDEGCYEITDINDIIQRKMRQNGHDEHGVKIVGNPNTLRAILSMSAGYKIDFGYDNSLKSVLGFTGSIYDGYNESEEVVNIMSINSIRVNIDIISGSYVNGSVQPTIYSFFPNVSPGYKIIENPRNLVYLPITLDTIHSIETVLTDQDGNQLNLRGETLTIRFGIRSI